MSIMIDGIDMPKHLNLILIIKPNGDVILGSAHEDIVYSDSPKAVQVTPKVLDDLKWAMLDEAIDSMMDDECDS